MFCTTTGAPFGAGCATVLRAHERKRANITKAFKTKVFTVSSHFQGSPDLPATPFLLIKAGTRFSQQTGAPSNLVHNAASGGFASSSARCVLRCQILGATLGSPSECRVGGVCNVRFSASEFSQDNVSFWPEAASRKTSGPLAAAVDPSRMFANDACRKNRLLAPRAFRSRVRLYGRARHSLAGGRSAGRPSSGARLLSGSLC